MPADLVFDPLGVPRRVHIVGVGGAGMSGLAALLTQMGHSVSGSDLAQSAVTAALGALGVPVAYGHVATNVSAADVVVASPAVPSDNVELEEARRRGATVLGRAQMLASVSRARSAVAVAGTHGKTTTSTMVVEILNTAGLDPSFLLGAAVRGHKTGGHLGQGPHMVIEADESYGSFEFLEPYALAVTSVEADHLDHYGDPATLHAAFVRLAEATTGPRLVAMAGESCLRLASGAGALLVGEDPGADYRLQDLELSSASTRFCLARPTGGPIDVALSVPGRFNAMNAAVAAATADALCVEASGIEAGLARFVGVPRRFERRGEAAGVSFVIDYAHLPGEVRAAISTARLSPATRVVAIFQPHRYTRTKSLAASFAHAFDGADVVFVTDVYGAGEARIEGVTGEMVSDALARAPGAPRVRYLATRELLLAAVSQELIEGDLCLVLGAGDI
ncbi:MAG: UDP-N-acetylmuramate--L-alanine ligase, partial [Acidimicrobiales bacterium]